MVCVRTCVRVCARFCVWSVPRAAELTVPFCKARAVTVCMCLCQHDGGEGCYSDLMNPSAFKGHSSSHTQAGANEQRPGSAPSGGLGGVQARYFQSKTSKDKSGLVLNSPHSPPFKYMLFSKRVEVESCTVTYSTLLFCT